MTGNTSKVQIPPLKTALIADMTQTLPMLVRVQAQFDEPQDDRKA